MANNSPTGEKKNWWGWATGAMNAVMAIGGLSPKGDVRSSWSVTGLDSRHKITMDEDGQRKGWTSIWTPGETNITSGKDLKREVQTIMVLAHNGDIFLKAAKGKIKLEADSIEMVANGINGEGHLMVNATERLEMKSKRILIEGKENLKLVATKSTLGIEAATIDVITDFFTGISKATRQNDTQTGGKI